MVGKNDFKYDIVIFGLENRDELQFFPLKYILENKYNLKVYIELNFMNYKRVIYKNRPKVIMAFQAAAPYLVNIYKLGKKIGAINISFRSEGLIYDDVDPNIFGVVEPYGNLVDFEILWGHFPKRILLNNYSLLYEKRIVLGAPKYSFYTKDKKKFFLSKKEVIEKLNLNKNSSLNVVIATGYGIAERNLDDFKLIPEYKFEKGENLNYLEQLKYLKSQRIEERNILIESVKKLVIERKYYNIVLKIHPNEYRYSSNNLQIYKELKKLEKNHKNFKIIYPYDKIESSDLFDFADYWFHRGSTTAIEAWMNNVVSVEMNFINDESIIKSKLTKGSLIVKNIKDILNILDNKQQYSLEQREIHMQLINDYFNGIDNNADFKISDFIYRNIKSHRTIKVSFCDEVNLYLEMLFASLKLSILDLLGRVKSNKEYKLEFKIKYSKFLERISRINYVYKKNN